jgi:hypothetical protein
MYPFQNVTTQGTQQGEAMGQERQTDYYDLDSEKADTWLIS